MPLHGIEPSGRFQTEGHGRRLLQPGPARQPRFLVRPRETGERFGEPTDVRRKPSAVLPELEDEAGIHRLLARRAEMYETRGGGVLGGDQGSERGDERNGGVARLLRSLGELGEIEELRTA